MATPRVSVIIPTFNRFAALLQTLEALEQQSLPATCFEAIVVDDGSDDATPTRLSEMTFPFPLSVLQQPNRGAATARNLGAAHASAPILLFLDADIIATPGLLEEHIRSHSMHEHALVAGRRVTWPAATSSHFSQLTDLEGSSSGVRRQTFQEAFSANLSIRAADFRALGGFDPDFPASGCEDIELAFRATQAGLQVIHNPAALGYHNHPQDLRQASRQAYAYQVSAALLMRKHPALRGQMVYLRDKEPIAWGHDAAGLVLRKVARRLLAVRPVLRAMEVAVVALERVWPAPGLLRFLYWKILGSYQLRGFRAGLRRYGPLPAGEGYR